MAKKVTIEVGHGGKDPGAVAGGLRESDINLVVGLELKRQLERHGVEVLISRTKDVDDPATAFREKVIYYKPDIHVSVHTNAGHGDGFEVFTQGTAASIGLCRCIEREVVECGQNSRGVKSNPGFALLNIPQTAAYCELGFIDNAKDLVDFDTADEQKKFGAAYAKGILSYFGITWKSEKTDTELQKLYRVQVGAFSNSEYAEAYLVKVKLAGFADAFIKSE